MLKLRPHHLICLFFYRGFGYNQEFIDNMNKIQASLKENSDEEIRLVRNCDMICEKCPNKNEKDSCCVEEKILKLDNNALMEFDLDTNKKYMFKDIIQDIYLKINEKNLIRLCKDCKWYAEGICSVEKIQDQRTKWSSLK